MNRSLINAFVVCAALALEGGGNAPRINPLPVAKPRRPKPQRSFADHGWKGDGVLPAGTTRQQRRADARESAKRNRKQAQKEARR